MSNLRIISILTVALLITVAYCTSIHRQLNVTEQSFVAQQEGFQTKIGEQGQKIVLQEQIIIDKNSELAKLSDSLEFVKNLKNQIQFVVKTEIKLDTVKIEVPIYVDLAGDKYLKTPFSFTSKSKWHGAMFTAYPDYVVLDSMYFVNRITVAFGTEKKGWAIFKKRRDVVYLEDDNPYSQFLNVRNIAVNDYYTRWSIGVHVGYGATIYGLTPVASVGLNYQLKRF